MYEMKLTRTFIYSIHFLLINSIILYSNSLENRKLDNIIWELNDIKDSIEIYREKDPDSDLVAVRGKCVINAPLAIILSLLIDTDYESQKEWVPNLIEFSEIESNSILDRLLYVHVDIPWPAHDRDFVYQAQILSFPEKNEIRLDYQSREEVKPKKKHVTRGYMKTLFILKRIDNNSTSVDLRSLVDPEGAVPKWIVNFAQRNYSYNMFMKIRELVNKKGSSVLVLNEIKEILKKNE